MRKFIYILIAIFISVIIPACNGNTNDNYQVAKPLDLKQPLEKANKHLNKTEETEIRDYIARYGWIMNESGTGLRYMIYKKSNKGNSTPEKGSIVKINYEVGLINGQLCYSSDSTGPKVFELGKGEAESGLEEGIMLLHRGDRAKFIIPSHLAYGLPGDLNKIPKRATLIYDVELLDFYKK